MEHGRTTIGASHPSEAHDFTNYFIGLSLVDVAFTEIHGDVYDIFFLFSKCPCCLYLSCFCLSFVGICYYNFTFEIVLGFEHEHVLGF